MCVCTCERERERERERYFWGRALASEEMWIYDYNSVSEWVCVLKRYCRDTICNESKIKDKIGLVSKKASHNIICREWAWKVWPGHKWVVCRSSYGKRYMGGLGLLSIFVCFAFYTGIPFPFCGHVLTLLFGNSPIHSAHSLSGWELLERRMGKDLSMGL